MKREISIKKYISAIKCLYTPNSTLRSRAWCISFPKSGRTWLKSLIAYYNAKKYNVNISYDTLIQWCENVQVPKVRFTHLDIIEKNEIKNSFIEDEYGFFKNKKILFLVRDPRDVVVSYFYQISKRENRYNKKIDDFVYDPIFGIKRIIAYYNLVAKALSISKQKKYICYENLKKDTEKEFYEIIEFIYKQKPCMKSLCYAVQENEFDNLKIKAENSRDILLARTNKNDPDSAKIRKGQIRGYLDELNINTIDFLNNYINENLNKDLEIFSSYSQ